MDKIVLGILAHVDAGKTTLSEGILYTCGKIRNLGRVDNKDAYLDTDKLEKQRGITIYSKQAVFEYGNKEYTLLDTPGHVDFSAEMERALQVLDYAILVISGQDGVQSHTLTLWKLFNRYEIPAFFFINKMDQSGTNRELILENCAKKLNENVIDFSLRDKNREEFFEKIAMCHEKLLEEYMETGKISRENIIAAIKKRWIFPVYFGAALKNEGVKELLDGMNDYMEPFEYDEDFGAKVYKITRDEKGNRITHLKVTGGNLKVKDMLGEEKINQIRIYSGEKFDSVAQVLAGTVCGVTGLNNSFAGETFGKENEGKMPIICPVLSYRIVLPDGFSANSFLPKMRELEEEEPELKVVWDEKLSEIKVEIMGEVQIEILQSLIRERFGVAVTFSQGKILYKETIKNKVEGVGHFEPLRHYAEVHLIIESGEPGSGITFFADCSEDILSKNWQRLIETHVEEKEHRGVLLGCPLTDVKITLVNGKAHLKHTEGGDFRQATYRAIRQGLMKADSKILEPYFDYILEIPTEMLGRAMTDLEKMCATLGLPETRGENSILRGRAPVSTLNNYQKELREYSGGKGQLSCALCGYYSCHNEEEILENSNYNPENDIENPTSSVFCSHGSGYVVPWYEVEEKMHLPLLGEKKENDIEYNQCIRQKIPVKEEYFMGEDEVNSIIGQASNANKRNEKYSPYKKSHKRVIDTNYVKKTEYKSNEKYLLVDGYNIVFAWDELNDIAKVNIDAARSKLMDIMCNYQGYKKCNLILVFDAYKVKGNIGQMFDYHNIHVVYTKEAETADQYIEKMSHKMGKDYDVTVATSDGLIQLIIRGEGCKLISSREFYKEVKDTEKRIKESLDNL